MLVPKVARPGDIVNVSRIYGGLGGAEATRMWAMMETPMAIFNVREIASVHQVARLSCLVLGTNDLLKESRALATGGRFAIVPWLSLTVLAARAYGLDVIDGVYNDFRDEPGFRAECEQGRTLGMDGKTLIHPGQVAVCNELFSPAPAEIDVGAQDHRRLCFTRERGERRHHPRRQDGRTPAPRHGRARGGNRRGDCIMTKTNPGNFFEDFRVGQVIRHATPRTVTAGDAALYTALYGSRFAVQSSEAFAKAAGYPAAPLDDLLVFHIVFGKTVPDISLNAVANLGYADCRFLKPVFAGETLTAVSEVIGLKENSSGKTGTVYVRSEGFTAAAKRC